LARLESVGALRALILSVIPIEFPLDAKDLGITRNEFHLPNYSAVVKLKGEITSELKILRHYPVPLSKATVAQLVGANENELLVLFEKAEISLNHMFGGNDEFEVYFPGSTVPGPKPPKKHDLPSQVLKQAKFFSRFFDLLVNDTIEIVSDSALQLLNGGRGNEVRGFQAVSGHDWAVRLSQWCHIYLLDRNVFRVVVDVIRHFPNMSLLDLALQCLEGGTSYQSILYDFLMDDEICFQKLSVVILANSKDVTALLRVANIIQNICFGDVSGQISFDDYNVIDRCIDMVEHLFADPCVELLTEADTLLERRPLLICFWVPAPPAQSLPNSPYQRLFA
jgi:hypothetical protein